MIMPATLSLIRQVFPDPAELATAIGAWSATAGAGAIIGPLAGGLLAEHFWWGAVFLVNVPVMVVAIPLARWLLPESSPARCRRWDALGGVFAGAGVLTVSFAIKEAAQHPVKAGLVFLVGAALLVAFVRRQLRIPHPLLNVRLFADRRVSAAVAAVVAAMAAMVGVEFALAQYLQLVLGCGPLWAGVRLLPMTLASIVGSLVGAPLLRAAGALVTTSAGLAMTAASLVPLLWLSSTERPWLFAGAISGIGLGLSAALTAASNILMGTVREERAGEVAGVEETCYELGGSLGVSVLGSVVGASYATRFAGDATGLPGSVRDPAAASLPAALGSAEQLPPELAAAVRVVARDAFVSGLHAAVLIAVFLIVIAAGWVGLTHRRIRNTPSEKLTAA